MLLNNAVDKWSWGGGGVILGFIHRLLPRLSLTCLPKVTVMAAEDAGIFVCRAQSREGLAEGRVKLELEGGASAPQASVTDTDLTAVAGQSITMNCQATGNSTMRNN